METKTLILAIRSDLLTPAGLLQFNSDTNHLKLLSDSTGVKAWSPTRLPLL